jgi:hypothetical protein
MLRVYLQATSNSEKERRSAPGSSRRGDQLADGALDLF